MPDVNPQTSSDQTAEPGDGRGRRPAAQTASAERPSEDRSFAGKEPAAADVAVRNPMTIGPAFEIEHEAIQMGQEMIRAGEQAFNEAMQIWRRSLEPLAAARMSMNRCYEDIARQMTGFGAARPFRAARPSTGAAYAALMGGPALDLKDLGDAYRLDVEAPGLNADDLDLSIKDGFLIICGHKAETIDGGAYQISERRFGRFERAVPLPSHVDRTRIDARLESGVLVITLPKKTGAASPGEKVQIHG